MRSVTSSRSPERSVTSARSPERSPIYPRDPPERSLETSPERKRSSRGNEACKNSKQEPSHNLVKRVIALLIVMQVLHVCIFNKSFALVSCTLTNSIVLCFDSFFSFVGLLLSLQGSHLWEREECSQFGRSVSFDP